MKRCFFTITCLVLVALVLAPAVMAQTPEDVTTDKRGQTGLKFLSLSVDARAAAMGSAMTAELNGSSTSMFYNPSSMAGMVGDFHLGVGQTQFIADITYNIASLAYRPSGGNYGVFGLALTFVDYGDFIGTVRSTNDAGFEDTGLFSPSATAVGLGYARSFTDRFSVGANIKYALQDLGSFPVARTEGGSLRNEDFDINTIAYDFGVVYNTGFRSLALGFVARNFSQELTYVRENFELPLTLQFGVSMDLVDLTSINPDQHSIRLSADVLRPRDFDEHVRVGLEYSLMDLIYLRGGFEQATVSEEQGVSLGGGINVDASSVRIGADYAYTDFGIFGSLNRISIQVGF